jgi:hypothetical protein
MAVDTQGPTGNGMMCKVYFFWFPSFDSSYLTKSVLISPAAPVMDEVFTILFSFLRLILFASYALLFENDKETELAFFKLFAGGKMINETEHQL